MKAPVVTLTAEAVRSVIIEVKVQPNEDRDVGTVVITTKTKLGPSKGAHTIVYMGKDKGQHVAVENNPKQMEIFTPDAPAKFPVVAGEKE